VSPITFHIEANDMMRALARTRLHAAICVFPLLLVGCGGGESRSADADTARAPAGQESPAPVASTEVQGANSLELRIGETRYALRSDSGGATRSPVYGVDGIEVVVVEVLNPENTVYAKADLYIAAGGAIEGEYALGHLGSPEVRNVPGRGQVVVAVEVGDEREMRVSGDGSLRIERDGSGLVARFSYSLNAFGGQPLDAPVSGEMRVGQAP